MRFKPVVLVVSCVLTPAASAQRIAPFSLVFATPAAGSAFTDAPTRIRLVFSERIEPTKGEIAVVSGDGHRFTLATVIDPHLADAIVAPVPSLPPGAYHVEWRVVSAKGLSLSGSYAFAFGPTAALPNVEAPGDSARSQSFSGDALSPLLRTGLEALLAIALVSLMIVWRRSRRPT